MGTRSRIAVRNADSTYSSIYCHWDGYPAGVGAKLQKHYSDPAMAQTLIALGGLSTLGAEIGQQHSFDNTPDGWCRVYHRDRGEPLVVEQSPDLDDLKAITQETGGEWYDWLPIHDWLVGQVFAEIEAAGQKPHWAYAAGMSRLSCCFCIMSSKADLTTAARLNPDLYRKYVNLERSTGQVMLMPSKTKGCQTLEQVTGILVDETEEVVFD